jgi:pimeloyl-ACP methyl ester carboxylesterase
MPAASCPGLGPSERRAHRLVRRAPVFLLALSGLLVLGQRATAEEVQIRPARLTLNANLERTADGWPTGPVVLMTHDTLAYGGSSIMRTLQDDLKQRGISSLAITLSLGIDNRLGMFDCLATHRHIHTAALDEIGAWLAWLKSRGVGKIVLLGHARGADQVAWFAAARKDPAIEGVALLAPQTWDPAKVAADYQHRYDRPLQPLIAKAQALVDAGQGGKILEHSDFLYCPDARVTAESFLSYYGPDVRLDTPTLLPRIGKPILVVVGKEDVVARDLEQRLKPDTDGRHLQFVVIDGADDRLPGVYAGELADKLAAFMARLR